MALKDARQCTAIAKSTRERCQNPAVTGLDVCRLHGGKSLRGVEHPNYKSGIYSKYAPAIFRDKVADFIAADPLDLTHELALTRAVLAEFMTRFEYAKPDAQAVHVMSQLINDIRKIIEAISRIRNDTALTAAELAFLSTRLSEMIIRYIDDPVKREAFVTEFFGIAGAVSAPEDQRRLGSSER